MTQSSDPRSNPTGVVAKGGKILIVDETPYTFKIIKPCRGWISRELVQHTVINASLFFFAPFSPFHKKKRVCYIECGWFSLTRDVAVVSQSKSSAPIKTLFGATLVHVCAVYEKYVIIDEPVYGKFNCSSEEKALLPIELHVTNKSVFSLCPQNVSYQQFETIILPKQTKSTTSRGKMILADF